MIDPPMTSPSKNEPRADAIGPDITIDGLAVANVYRDQLVTHVLECLSHGVGGWIVTANTDFLARIAKSPALGALYRQADVIVADGVPLVWASKLAGTPLVDRVAGSDLVWLLAERGSVVGRSIYLLGGDDGVAERACRVLGESFPELEVSGFSSPWVANPPTDAEIDGIRRELRRAPADIVYVALSSPKQEHVIQRLRDDFPRTWFIGVGISFSFIVGEVKRAPGWMQKLGIEWIHRLIQEPRKLAKRYLIDDLPFGIGLMWRSLRARSGRR
ncbi:MAG: WecB/TagA/CpsF family glycosyltransferase [Planctomycetes bacterium]|nr:WecB/TagA/CpsF family glycosyltransferase [Planctomycetota bacterium]